MKLLDTQDKHVFYDKLTFVYLEMPKFHKKEEELVTMFDKWLFVLRNLSRLLEKPKALQERIFTRVFEQAEIARYTLEERMDYEESLKVYRDLNNVVNTADEKGFNRGLAEGEAKGRAEGLAEGKAEGIAEGEAKGRLSERRDNAKKMKDNGISPELIQSITGLSLDDIENL